MSTRVLPYTTEAVYNRVEQSWLSQQEKVPYTQAMRQAVYGADAFGIQSPFLFLPGLCCQAAGGDPAEAVRAAAAWMLLYRAANIFDDWEDGDATIGSTPSLNVATGLIFAAVNSLVDPAVVAAWPDQMRLAVVQDFAHAGLQVCAGQHADLVETSPSLDACWEIVQAKSGACFALACRAGARLAQATAPVIEHYADFGHHLGMAIQIYNDVKGLSPAGRPSDLASGRRTLPVAYALSVAPPELQERLLRCLQSAPHDREMESRSRRLIEETGAVIYLAVEVRRHWALAKSSLQAADPLAAPRDQLVAWFSEILSLEP